MNLVDRIKARFAKRQEEINDEALLPNQYNRAGRRALGFRGPVDPDWVQHESSFFVPRYIRRHYKGKVAQVSPSRTRRERKVRSRIVRLVTQIGNQKYAS